MLEKLIGALWLAVGLYVAIKSLEYWGKLSDKDRPVPSDRLSYVLFPLHSDINIGSEFKPPINLLWHQKVEDSLVLNGVAHLVYIATIMVIWSLKILWNSFILFYVYVLDPYFEQIGSDNIR